MYRGSYNRLLKELVLSPQMLRVMRADEPYYRLADCELVLRFFTMSRLTHLRYRGSMLQAMNREMEVHRNAPPDELDRCR